MLSLEKQTVKFKALSPVYSFFPETKERQILTPLMSKLRGHHTVS